MKRTYLALLCICILSIFVGACGLGNPTTGEKVGTVIRVAQSGILCTTYEGTIVRGGLNAGSGGFATQPYDFTVTSRPMFEALQQAMENQQEVRLKYQAEGLYSLCRSDSGGHFATEITVNNSPTGQ